MSSPLLLLQKFRQLAGEHNEDLVGEELWEWLLGHVPPSLNVHPSFLFTSSSSTLLSWGLITCQHVGTRD